MKRYVVMPCKGHSHYTKALLGQLLAQGEAERIFVLDNGSTDDTVEWLEANAFEKVSHFDASGMFLQPMWNWGLKLAEAHAQGDHHSVAILNNDLRIGDHFLSRLEDALRCAPDIGAAGAKYDARVIEGQVQDVRSICANRYDGTGGLPGFAFMVRGEDGYRFPDELHWWFGDNDLVLTVLSQGRRCVISRDATCEHLDGGERTGNWYSEERQRLIAQDRAWFEQKWGIAKPAKVEQKREKWRDRIAKRAQRLQLRTEPQSVMIATPMQDTCLAVYAQSLVRCIAHSLAEGVRIGFEKAQYSMLPISRNLLATKAIETGCTHLLFIDSDMEFPPDLAVRLLRHKLSIVAINCMARRHPYYLTARSEDKQEIPTHRDSSGIEKVARVGTGIMLIHLDVLREMPQPWFEYRWVKDHFQGEDYTFCDKAREAGHEIYIDHDLSKQVSHVGTFAFTPLMRAGFVEVQQQSEQIKEAVHAR